MLAALERAHKPLSKTLELQIILILENGPKLNGEILSQLSVYPKELKKALEVLKFNKLISSKQLTLGGKKFEYALTPLGVSALEAIHWLICRDSIKQNKKK